MYFLWSQGNTWSFYGLLLYFNLTFSRVMLKNSQTYFTNLAVFKPQIFKSIFGHFFNILLETVKLTLNI